MADEQEKNENINEEVDSSESSEKEKPLNPQSEAVQFNHPREGEAEEASEPDIDQAAKDLNESLEKGKEAMENEEVKDSDSLLEGEKGSHEESAEEVKESASEAPEKAEDKSDQGASSEDAGQKEDGAQKKELSSGSSDAEAMDDKKKEGAPKKIGKEKAKAKSNTRFLTYLGLGFVGLFVAFVVLMVLVIGAGGEDSAVLSAFGLDAAGIKSFLLLVVNLSFGFLSFLFFIILILGLFKFFFAKKTDKDAKKKGVRMSLLGVIPFALTLGVWLFLFTFINQLQIDSERVIAEIIVLSPENIEEIETLQAPLDVTFSSENVIRALQNSDLVITGARWDMDGDGVYELTPNGFEVTTEFTSRGTHNVGFEVFVEGEEQTRRYDYPLFIDEAVFGASESSGTAPLNIQFDASDIIPEGAKVKALDWDFDGDGIYEEQGTEMRPRYTFNQVGTYRVHLRFQDENNVVENYYREIEIVPSDRPLLTASIEASPGLKGEVPLQIRFDAGRSESVKGNVISYEWDFGDGSQLQKGRSVTHVYEEPDYYTVTLTVKDDVGNEASNSKQVEAGVVSSEPEPVINLDIEPDEEGVYKGFLPLSVSFDASDSLDADDDIVDFEWDFGDGGTATGENVSHVYEQVGAYDVRLLVRDSTDQQGSTQLTIEVEEPGVRAVILADPEQGTAPLSVSFDGSTSSTFKGKIVSYKWDFGDGSAPTITGSQVTHKYINVGTYEVKLEVVTNENETAVTTRQVFVREIPLKACFEPSRTTGLAPLSVTFDSKCSTGPVAVYNWTFGDGEESEARKPAHTFDAPGTYNVTLEVEDDKSNVSEFNQVIVVEGQVQ